MSESVSVILPTYNGAAFVEQAIRSVISQTVPAHELIIVDDASKDHTVEVVRQVAAHSPICVHIIKLRKNSGGPAHPINIGISRATGDFIAVLDQDDIFLPTRLADQLRGFQDNPSVGLAFCLCADLSNPKQILQLPGNENRLLRNRSCDQDCLRVPRQTLLYELMIQGNFVLGYPGFMFRRHHWVAKGGLDEGYRIVSDHDMLFWLAGRTDALFVPKILYWRRIHNTNLSSRLALGHGEDALLRYRYLKRHPSFLYGSVSPELVKLIEDLIHGLYRFGHPGKALDLILRAAAVSGWDRDKIRLAARLLFPERLRSANQLLNRGDSAGYHGQPLVVLRRQLGVALRRLPFGSSLVELFRNVSAYN